MKKIILLVIFLLAVSFVAPVFAGQSTLRLKLLDGSTSDPVSFATVSLTREGASKVFKYVLSDADGAVRFEQVPDGRYTVKAELMGYKPLERKVTVKADLDMGTLKMETDIQALEAARVTAEGNPIVIKKDTIEYNASSFKTTENDVLEDLLKKLPGVEVGDDGSVTVNGQSITKITIDGKTFFLDDPQLATKNIPANIINKVKVIEKKSEQAEFTGIDDGEEEHVIDLNIKPGMMKGAFGSLMAGGGADLPDGGRFTDARYQTAGFVGNFTDKQQLSALVNGNNTNNRGFNDLAGSMMGNMRGGGMGRGMGAGGRGDNGITTSWMAGANGAWTLFDNKMDLGSNYLFNFSDKYVAEKADETRYQGGDTLLVSSQGDDRTYSRGHRFGVRLEHKFSENTSIIFEPQVNFGSGSFLEQSEETKYSGIADENHRVSDVSIDRSGFNKNVSTSGFLLFRQRLGIPGRTITVMGRYSYSNNNLNGTERTDSRYYTGEADSLVNQRYTRKSDAVSLTGNVTYTEPLGNCFYLEGNYSVRWNKNVSDKNTTDLKTGLPSYENSNNILNASTSHTIGANLMYQREKSRAQIGLSAIPTTTSNNTTRYDAETGRYAAVDPYRTTLWRWSPQAMVWWEFNENANARLFYRGTTSQPDISKLMPVPDNADPNNVKFGNPSLKPYFSHNIRGDIRYNNKETFTSFNIRLSGGFVQDPVVSLIWNPSASFNYTMPFNGPTSGNANMFSFVNIPIRNSGFSIANMLSASWSVSSSYMGRDIDMTTYREKGYYAFMEEMITNFNDAGYFADHVTTSTTDDLSVTERLRGTFRTDALELQASARTLVRKNWFKAGETSTSTTKLNNQLRAGINWTWDAPGLVFKSEFSYNWYNGYTENMPAEYILDAEIQKTLFKKRMTLALKGYDILGQAKNHSVSYSDNIVRETVNNTLGRYLILTLTWRFGNFDRDKVMNSVHRGHGGPPRM